MALDDDVPRLYIENNDFVKKSKQGIIAPNKDQNIFREEILCHYMMKSPDFWMKKKWKF